MEYVLAALLLVSALFLVVAVLLQKDKSNGLSGTISGSADTFYGRTGGSRIEAVLEKWTVIVGVIFALLVFIMYVVQPDYTYSMENIGYWKEISEFSTIFD